MDPIFWFNVLTRWLHITSAAIGIGALVFLRLGDGDRGPGAGHSAALGYPSPALGLPANGEQRPVRYPVGTGEALMSETLQLDLCKHLRTKKMYYEVYDDGTGTVGTGANAN